MNPSQIRKKFLEYFKNNGHELVKSSPVIPAQDPTLLFANAGMNQFKDIFVGKEVRSYKTATSSQKCVRAGGKHNDLDQVGFTKRHLTFFEMLGNFSFGDYFKREAIKFAWKFLTEDMGMDKEKLSITVFKDDLDSEKIWMEDIGVPKNKITRMDEEENFWRMGDTGPCGPCTEIFYDRGEKYDSQGHDERFIEVWNMVFMQYNQQEDGQLKPLEKCGVDAGMGLERLVSVLDGADSVFDTALFAPMRSKIEQVSGKKYSECDEKTQAAFNVLSDHIRSSSFIIADGGKPSNDGRGYVLRKIIRRALMFSKKLSSSKDLFVSLVDPLIEAMGDGFPELTEQKGLVTKIIGDETDRFFSNLEKGERIFASYMKDPEVKKSKLLSGGQAFKLYDTYGFPVEITRIMAMEEGLDVDMSGFEQNMERQKQQSGKTKKAERKVEVPDGLAGEFVGYQQTRVESKINWIGELDKGKVWVSTDQNPFFATRGGQVSDSGFVEVAGAKFNVVDVKEPATSATTKTVIVLLDGPVDQLKVGQDAILQVDEKRRADTAKNHSATHLIHAALRKVLGPHATQAGSVVDPDYLRFDFNHDKALTKEEIEKSEIIVNDWIQEAIDSKIVITDMDEAERMGADAIFGEKYNPESVRVIDFPGMSVELCGGTHLRNTGEVGSFKIVSEESMGIGVRRIFAVTGPKAFELLQSCHASLKALSQKYACKIDKVVEAVEKESEKLEQLNKKLQEAQGKLAAAKAGEYEKQFKTLGDIDFVFVKAEAQDAPNLRTICEQLAASRDKAVVFCISDLGGGKVSFVVGMNKALQGAVDLGKLSKEFASLGLRGGGKGLFVQGGGKVDDFGSLPDKIESIFSKT